MKTRFFILLLMIGLLSACGTQATAVPTSASQSTEPPVVPTQTVANTSAPTDTALPATEPASQGVTVSFATDILPILNSRCRNCHGGNRTEEGLKLLTYADVMSGSKNGLVVTSGDANDSLLVELVSTQKMPKRGPKLTPAQIQLIIDWINQGALDN